MILLQWKDALLSFNLYNHHLSTCQSVYYHYHHAQQQWTSSPPPTTTTTCRMASLSSMGEKAQLRVSTACTRACRRYSLCSEQLTDSHCSLLLLLSLELLEFSTTTLLRFLALTVVSNAVSTGAEGFTATPTLAKASGCDSTTTNSKKDD